MFGMSSAQLEKACPERLSAAKESNGCPSRSCSNFKLSVAPPFPRFMREDGILTSASSPRIKLPTLSLQKQSDEGVATTRHRSLRFPTFGSVSIRCAELR